MAMEMGEQAFNAEQQIADLGTIPQELTEMYDPFVNGGLNDGPWTDADAAMADADASMADADATMAEAGPSQPAPFTYAGGIVADSYEDDHENEDEDEDEDDEDNAGPNGSIGYVYTDDVDYDDEFDRPVEMTFVMSPEEDHLFDNEEEGDLWEY
ncbi:hypothetical protein PG994_014409 [Apiospora phragmitis]|uniref:Uncharacterized protein n=1 Tax=Apiospora phragmitis TaxID=2905665 RepID=A0ABR1T491_9PEZI